MLVSLLLSLPLFFSLLSFPPPYPSLLTEAPFLLLFPLASLYKSFAPVCPTRCHLHLTFSSFSSFTLPKRMPAL